MKKINQAISATALLRHAEQESEQIEDPIIRLLKAVAKTGSINKAAKEIELSYKATWERIDTLNNLSPAPLIKRQTGGSGGGGTVLTEAGHLFLKRAVVFQSELQKLVSFFQDTPKEAFTMLQTLKGMEMKISARNLWLGNVTRIETGAVNSVVTIALKGKDTIVSTITENSVQRLGLVPGKEVYAIVKAPSVLLSRNVDPNQISARNILEGTVSRIDPGAVNDEVTLQIASGNSVTSILTSESVQTLGLKEGVRVSAVIKASSVLLALP